MMQGRSITIFVVLVGIILINDTTLVSTFTPLQNNKLSGSSSCSSNALLCTGSHEKSNHHPTTTTTTTRRNTQRLKATKEEQQEGANNKIWNPRIRSLMGGIATMGALETAYLTFTKVTGNNVGEAFCGIDGSCQSVLDSAYAAVPYTNGNIPLAALGFIAYAASAVLALSPVLNSNSSDAADDTTNRILLTTLTTTMGTFSIFLMGLLHGVIHTSCNYCIASAVFSIVLAKLCWIGGALPSKAQFDASTVWEQKDAKVTTFGGVLTSVLVSAALLFSNGVDDSFAFSLNGNEGAGAGASTSTLVAAADTKDGKKEVIMKPPAITTSSSDRAKALSKSLKKLDATMYGAYWCSHCYDQKQTLGKEAFMKDIAYVECAKEGFNAQNALCKEKKLPGYPTWEIQGQLYPGEQELEELEELVSKINAGTVVKK